MGIIAQDTLVDASPGSNTLLENHATSIPGTNWAALVAALASSAQFIGAGQGNNRIRPAQLTNHARYLDPGSPATGAVDIAFTLHGAATVDASTVAGAVVLAIGGGSDGTAYDVNYVHGASGWQVNKVHSDGVNRDSKLNNGINTINGVSQGATALGMNTDVTIAIRVRNNATHPRFQVYSNGTLIYDETDTATLFSAVGKRTGITVFNSDSLLDGHGAHIKGTYTVTDYVPIVASPTTLNTSTSGQVVALVGMDTTWDGSTSFSLSGAAATGSSITAHTVTDATHATVTITTGSTTGTLTITDNGSPSSAVSVTVQSSAPTSTILAMSGPSGGLTGQASGDFTISTAPGGSTPASDTVVTLGDGSAGGTWSPTAVILGTSAPTAKATYTPPANAGGTARTTRTLSATAGGFTAAAAQYVGITPATTYTVTPPASFTAGTASSPITVTLPAGLGVPSPTAIFLSDGGAGGQFSQEGGTVTSDSGSFQSTYTAPHGVTSVTISATNNGGLTNPSPTVVPVTAASNYSMGAPKVGPAGRISTPITLVLTDPDVTGTVICTLSDVSAMGTWSGTNLLTGNQVALTQGAPVQTVFYTPAADLVAEGDAPVAVTLSVSNDRDLVDPPDVTYAVYDPTTYGEVAFLALYSQFAASGQAAALGITVYGKGNTTVVAHTTQYTEELGSTGDYVFVVPVPLLQSGAASMDPPSGQAQGYSQAYSAQGVSPVLAPADLTGIGATPIAALGAHALDSVQLIATDLTTFSIDEPLLLKWLRFVFYFLTNVTLSSGGTFTVKNSTGQTIVADLVATETSDQTVIGPGG